MHADDNVGTPALEEFADKADTAAMEELAGLGPEAIDSPEIIFHPVLLVPQQPIVKRDHLRRDVMRFFDCTHDANRIGLAGDNTLHASHDCRRRRAMATAGIRRDNQDFWSL